MRFATVGTSGITDFFIKGAFLAGGWELAAVYSRNADKGRAFSEKYGDIPVYTNLNKMASLSELDAVYIASPNILHYEQSKLFLEHGIHVICEKPVTVTPAQYTELLEYAKSHGLIYMEAIMMRHLPARSVLKQATERIGNIRTARFDHSQLSSKYPALLSKKLPNIFNPKMAAGCLMDLGVYCVYAAVDLFGVPSEIHTAAGFLTTGADGYGTCIFGYADKLVTLTYSKVGDCKAGSEIIGDKGTISIGSVSKFTDIKIIQNGKSELLVGDIPKEQLMSGEASDFKRYIENPSLYKEELDSVARLAENVQAIMEKMRSQAGICFPSE